MENIQKKEQFGSRIGYILSTLGMAIGVGAMWRFPMMCAQWGGGAFVIAFVIVSVICVLPAGFAESATGRKYRKSAVGTFGEILGKKGKALGYIMGATPLALSCYYPVVMALVVEYIFYSIAGAPFLKDTEGFFTQVNDGRTAIYIIVAAIIILTVVISLKGIQKGIERACKFLLPVMFILMVIVMIRVFTVDGIADGINFYVAPNLEGLKDPKLWMAASGMALFAVGLGPGYLLTYGQYLDKDADLATDFVTVNVTQLLICVMSGFICIPIAIVNGVDPAAGKGLIFQSLPLIFDKMPGGIIWFILFMVAIFFAGLSTMVALLEVPASCIRDTFNVSREKGVAISGAISLLIAIPCVWSDSFFAWFDNLVGNVFYSFDAAAVAVILAWYVGAKKIREEWYNPTSVIKYGGWVDYLYKFPACAALIYFAILAIMTLF